MGWRATLWLHLRDNTAGTTAPQVSSEATTTATYADLAMVEAGVSSVAHGTLLPHVRQPQMIRESISTSTSPTFILRPQGTIWMASRRCAATNFAQGPTSRLAVSRLILLWHLVLFHSHCTRRPNW